jgi:hypothetical protein
MNRIPIPKGAKILVELGAEQPQQTAYNASSPFQLLWVITNGIIQRKFLWITVRKTGIYVAFGGPGNIHTSYHMDGKFHWKVNNITQNLGCNPPLPSIPGPILIQSATAAISDDALDRFKLTIFDDSPVNSLIYIDNRILPNAVYYHVWVVPPFKHGDVPLITKDPAHIHLCTHTNPWIEVIIYEQRSRNSNEG